MARTAVRRDLAEEQSSLASTLTRPEDGGAYTGTPGASVPDMSDATKQLLQESINMRSYGTATPEFTTPQGPQVQSPPTDGGEVTYAREDGTTGTGDVVSGGTDTSQMSVEDLMAQISSARQPTETISYEDQLARELEAGQAQLDAINKIYDYRIGEAKVEGQGRLGQTRALSSVSGTLFDPFGAANKSKTERYNTAQITAINQERAQELANIYAAARGEATRKVERLEDQAREDADVEINRMIQMYQLSSQEASSVRDSAYQIAMLTGMYGGEQTMAMRQYLQDVEMAQADATRANGYLDIAAEQARQAGYQVDTQPDGTIGYYDYSSGAPQWVTLGNYAKPTTGSGSASGYIRNDAGFSEYGRTLVDQYLYGIEVTDYNNPFYGDDGSIIGYGTTYEKLDPSDLSQWQAKELDRGVGA